MTLFFCPSPILLRNPNNTTGRSPARIPSYFALFMSTFSQIICTAMYHDSPSEHALWADKLDEVVGQGAFGVALFVGFEVAKVSDVALGVGGGTVLFAEGVDWWRRRALDLLVVVERQMGKGGFGGGGCLKRTVGTSTCAAICVVAELMNVHATLGGGVVAADVVGDGGGG